MKELEKLASRKLRINAKETMKIAEKLYTQGYISYPRTETNIFAKDFNLPELVQNQVNDSNWGGLLSRLWFIVFGLSLYKYYIYINKKRLCGKYSQLRRSYTAKRN
jgi:hypothetical protein